MARKPLDGTVADNVLKHGVGGINIDGCRVEFGDEKVPRLTVAYEHKSDNNFGGGHDGRLGKVTSSQENATTQGRFPANVIHDGSDEVVALFPSDGEDSNARFFYTAKASQTERNWGLDGFESDVTTDGRNKPIDNAFNRGETQRKNIHPTVKPIDLMRYLVRLVTPKGGVCLDPFLGSGTTAVACKSEKFDYIGIELSQEYADIAEARIKAEVVQYDIFDILEG
jgi:site-specific DNA-methyltransferase (adenine-specific)